MLFNSLTFVVFFAVVVTLPNEVQFWDDTEVVPPKKDSGNREFCPSLGAGML